MMLGNLFFILVVMLFGDRPVRKLEKVSSKMWNAPLDSQDPWSSFVDVVGLIEDYHVVGVSFFFFFSVCYMVCC